MRSIDEEGDGRYRIIAQCGCFPSCSHTDGRGALTAVAELAEGRPVAGDTAITCADGSAIERPSDVYEHREDGDLLVHKRLGDPRPDICCTG